jgi:hypothetical protein
MTRKHKSRRQVYAVLRADQSPDPTTPLEVQVTVKEVVTSEEIAIAEVKRLTALNSPKGSRYWYQATRLFPPGESSGSGSVAA